MCQKLFKRRSIYRTEKKKKTEDVKFASNSVGMFYKTKKIIEMTVEKKKFLPYLKKKN